MHWKKRKNEHTETVKRILLTVGSLWLWTADRWRSMFWWWRRAGYVNWHLLGNARQIIRFLNVRLYTRGNELVFFRHHRCSTSSTLTIWCMWCEWFPPSKFSCVESCCCCCCPIASESKTKRKKKSFPTISGSQQFSKFAVPVCSMLLCSSEVRSVDADPDPALIRTPTILNYT